MRYLKHFEAKVNLNQHKTIDNIEEELKYLSQTFIDDYDGEISMNIKNGMLNGVFGLAHDKAIKTDYIDYSIQLDIDSILSEQYKDKVYPLINADSSVEIELPYSKYDIENNDPYSRKKTGMCVHSQLNKYLSKSDIKSDIFQSSAFKPEFLKELKKFIIGIKDAIAEKYQCYRKGHQPTYYNITLFDYGDREILLNILLF